jgi:hypothetical protein
VRPMSSEPVRRIGLGSSSGHDPKRTGSPYHERDRSESRKLERKIEKITDLDSASILYTSSLNPQPKYHVEPDFIRAFPRYGSALVLTGFYVLVYIMATMSFLRRIQRKGRVYLAEVEK